MNMLRRLLAWLGECPLVTAGAIRSADNKCIIDYGAGTIEIRDYVVTASGGSANG